MFHFHNFVFLICKNILNTKNTKFIDMFYRSALIITGLFFLGLFIACKNDKTDTASNTENTEAKVDSSNIIHYTVSLGVMPDLNHEGAGMLVGHVNDGKAAFKAGILKGDIVVQMDSMDITDLVSYTKALSTYEKGDEAKVVVKRDDQLIKVLVQF